VVDRFYRRVLDDPQLGRFFEGVDMTKHTRKFLLFVTYVLGGPDEYLQLNPQPWPALYSVHEELMRRYGLRERHFDLVKGHFGEALQDAGAPQNLIDMALGVVETTRRIMFPPGGAHEEADAEDQQAATAAATAGGCPYHV
jgi:truncated hemoglobin YjbI